MIVTSLQLSCEAGGLLSFVLVCPVKAMVDAVILVSAVVAVVVVPRYLGAELGDASVVDASEPPSTFRNICPAAAVSLTHVHQWKTRVTWTRVVGIVPKEIMKLNQTSIV